MVCRLPLSIWQLLRGSSFCVTRLRVSSVTSTSMVAVGAMEVEQGGASSPVLTVFGDYGESSGLCGFPITVEFKDCLARGATVCQHPPLQGKTKSVPEPLEATLASARRMQRVLLLLRLNMQ